MVEVRNDALRSFGGIRCRSDRVGLTRTKREVGELREATNALTFGGILPGRLARLSALFI